jgi:hypothetical protein
MDVDPPDDLATKRAVWKSLVAGVASAVVGAEGKEAPVCGLECFFGDSATGGAFVSALQTCVLQCVQAHVGSTLLQPMRQMLLVAPSPSSSSSSSSSPATARLLVCLEAAASYHRQACARLQTVLAGIGEERLSAATVREWVSTVVRTSLFQDAHCHAALLALVQDCLHNSIRSQDAAASEEDDEEDGDGQADESEPVDPADFSKVCATLNELRWREDCEHLVCGVMCCDVVLQCAWRRVGASI